MGIFDSLKSKSDAMYSPICEQEAWVSIMHACMSANGEVSEVETDKMIAIMTFKNIFENHDIVDYIKKAIDARNRFGEKIMIEKSAPLIPKDDRATLFSC